MQTEHTLRYLLLRHLRRCQPAVPPARFLEVTGSLRVSAGRDEFVVAWRDGDQDHRRTFPRNAFVFYRRGDRAPASHRLDDELRGNANDALAARFAADVFGVEIPAPAPPAPDPFARLAVGEAVALAAVLAGMGLPAGAASLLLLACLVEHLPGGRLWSAAVLVLLAVVGPPAATAAGAGAYGLLQLLDPDPRRRPLRIALCALAAGLGAVRAAGGVAFGVTALAATPIAVAVIVWRSLLGTHRRALPLALPLWCAGLALDGRPAAALAGLGVLALGAAATAVGPRWLPVQQERRLTAYG